MDLVRVAVVSGTNESELETNINKKIKQLEGTEGFDSIIDVKFGTSTTVEAPVFGGITGTKKLLALVMYMMLTYEDGDQREENKETPQEG